ncbi:hypothetical protein [Anaerolinea sp.]|uniref:hypothetical protein n=1 Tax=Anaerolinea sp. TaxID=1872519 RepID=UPI002ACDB6F5|nr:hypothetical protein [Anaerolinea sp.]
MNKETGASFSGGCGMRFHRLVLALVLLALAWMGLGRALWAWTDRDLLARYGAQPGWEYLMVTGGIGALLALSAAGLTLWGNPRWFRIVFLEVVIWTGLYWADLLFFSRSGEALLNLGFTLGVSIAGLFYAGFALDLLPALFSRLRR